MINFFYNFWVIQAIGAVGLVFIILAWNAKTRRNILFLQSIYLAILVIHYFLLTAFAGAAMCVVTILRNSIFIQKKEKKWADHPISGLLSQIVTIVGILSGMYGHDRGQKMSAESAIMTL